MTAHQSIAFQRIKPLCVDLSRQAFLPKATFNPNSDQLLHALRSLEQELCCLDREDQKFSPKFADYVFVPIASLLQQDSLGTSQTESILLIISHLLSSCWSPVGSFPQALAQQLFPLLTYLISNDKDNANLLKKPAHFQLAGCLVLKALFDALAAQKTHKVYDYFFDGKTLPSLGHSVTILLDILQGNENEVELQLAAIDALRALYLDLLGDGEIISYILPGNVSAFSKLLMKPGLSVKSDVVCSVIQLFGSILSLVYRDSDLRITRRLLTDLHQVLESCGSTTTKAYIDETASQNKKIHRDNKWLKATTSQVKIALESILPKLIKRDNANINSAIGSFLETVMTTSNLSLINCVELFVSTTLNIRSAGPKFFESPDNSRVLKHLLDNQILNFSKTIQFENSKDLETFGYALRSLKLHGEINFEMMSRAVTVLLRSLSEFLEQKNVRFNKAKIVEQSNLVIIGEDFFARADSALPLLPKLSISFEKALSNLLLTIGFYGGKSYTDQIVVTLLSENYSESLYGKSIAAWVSSVLIKGSIEHTDEENDLADRFLVLEDPYMVAGEPSEAYYMVLESCLETLNNSVQNGKTLSHSSEFHVIVGLHSIKLMSDSMGEAFQGELIDVIFPVMDCLASSSPAIRNFAQATTLAIARNHYAGSVHDLISDNMDYLVDSISIRLKNCMTERIATLLTVICRIGGYEIIRSFKDVLEMIFRILDYYHGYDDLCADFFQLFDIVVTEMNKEFLHGTCEVPMLGNEFTVSGSFRPWGMQNMLQVVQALDKTKEVNTTEDVSDVSVDELEPGNFEEFLNRKLEEVDSDDEDEECDPERQEKKDNKEDKSSDAKEKWGSPIPRDSYRLLLQIVGYGDRLLTHPSRPLKVQILRLMCKIYPMLATEYDMLLPQVAKSWDLVVQISLDADFAVAKPAFECLREMIKWSGDFITKRFIDLWDTYKTESAVLRSVAPIGMGTTPDSRRWLSTAKHFPSITREALSSLSEMVLEGISKTELFIPEVQLQEMVYCCILSSPMENISSRSLILGDIVSLLSNQDSFD